MSEGKKILIAEADKVTSSALKGSLKSRGFSVSVVADGAEALQKALENPQEMIVISMDLPTIDGMKLSQILRANPRTEPVPQVFISPSEIQIPHFQRHRDSLFIRPINADEVASRIDSFFDRAESVKKVSKEERVIKGNLSEIYLADLLQMFYMNRKEGTLFLMKNREKGEIFIQDGNILDAKIGHISGEKAFFRLLGWKKGDFTFMPGRVMTTQKITRAPDNLIMEGLRQHDEWENLKEQAPSLESRVKLLVDPTTLPKGLRPVTQEIFLLIEFYPRIADIIDRNTFPDYEVMRTIMTLLNKGIIGITKEKAKESVPILNKEDIIKLKDKLSVHRKNKLDMEIGKILIFSMDNDRVRHVVNAINALPEFHLNPDFLKGMGTHPYLGSAGHLQLSEGIQVNFIIVPLSDRFSPLWRPLSNSMLSGLIVLSEERNRWDELKNICSFFNGRLGRPISFTISDAKMTEYMKKEIGERVGVKGETLLFSMRKNDADKTRSALNSVFQSIIGSL